MLMSQINLNSPSKTSFGAKLSNIKLKDETAKSINELLDVVGTMKPKLPCNEIQVANTKAVHSPYMAGYEFNLEKGKSLWVDFDENKRLFHISLNHNTKNSEGNNIIKSFNYYMGHPKAPNPVPEMNYMEYEPMNRGIVAKANYPAGTSVSDNIANSIKNVVDTILGSLGKK